MLVSLYIQNLAVIEKVSIDFTDGMNLFTGETGAGKSIVIDAINAILGGRCSREMVRRGTNKATIVGTFQKLPKMAIEIAKKYEWDVSEDGLILQRDIFSDGRTTARVGGFPVTVSSLRELGAVLIDIHGQHDNQILLSPEKHIDILDNFGELNELLKNYNYHFERKKRLSKELHRLQEDYKQKEARLNEIQEIISEIEEADLEPGEDAELESDAHTIKNAAFIVENLEEAYRELSGYENCEGCADKVSRAAECIEAAAGYYDELSEVSERVRGLSYELQELTRTVSHFINSLDFDSNRLEAIEQRLYDIYQLKRKYGGTIESVLETLKKSQDEVSDVELYDSRLNELMVGYQSANRMCDQLALQLTDMRKQAAEDFVRYVSKELSFLDMSGVRMGVEFVPCELYTKGREQLEFLISTNVGEPPKPISKVASGGELSRIMLSIKNVLASKDETPTLIFDEVDSGVSGSAAQKIGLKLKQAASNHQVICVTHLPQVAALADSHFCISKKVQDGRTFTEVNLLDEDDRVEEIARIMSAGEVTQLTRKAAQEMIQKGKYISEKF